MVMENDMVSLRRRIFSVLFLTIFSSMLGIGIILPLLPIYAEDLGAKGLAIGFIFSGFSLSRSVFSPIVGRLSDRWGRKVFITTGLFLYWLVGIGFLFSNTVMDLIIVRCFQGFAAAMIIPLAMAYIGEISPLNKEGRYMGLFTVSLFAGFGTGPLLGGMLMSRYGIRIDFYAMIALCFVAFILVLVYLPEQRTHEQEGRGQRSSFMDIMKSPVSVGLLLFRFTQAYARGVLITFLPIFTHNTIGMNASEIGLVISANILLNAFLQAPFGRLADRFNKTWLIFSGAFPFALSMIAITHTLDFFQVFSIAMVMGISGALSLPSASAIAVIEGRKYGMGSIMGLYNMAMSIGLAVGPISAGLISDLAGLRASFYSAGFVGMLGVLGFMYLMRLEKPQ
jgi:MFS family permease